ncbi:MAG: ATP-binding cassette domain-containing protein, partial [Candidatus Thermoplasmatota archaeon]|nr:ATP-binding cassette domain-containing protein [Candidatus Thermoplasmatota archaeon]
MAEKFTSPLIELRGVRRVYASAGETVAALDGIDLDLKQGEVVVMLLGPSGSGKTTLLNVLSAMDSPTEGTYRFLGEEVPTAPDALETTRFALSMPHPLL